MNLHPLELITVSTAVAEPNNKIETDALSQQVCNPVYHTNATLATAVSAAIASAVPLAVAVTAGKDVTDQANWPVCAVRFQQYRLMRAVTWVLTLSHSKIAKTNTISQAAVICRIELVYVRGFLRWYILMLVSGLIVVWMIIPVSIDFTRGDRLRLRFWVCTGGMTDCCAGNTALGLVLCQPIVALSADITAPSNQTNSSRSNPSLPSPSVFMGGTEHGLSLDWIGSAVLIAALFSVMLLI